MMKLDTTKGANGYEILFLTEGRIYKDDGQLFENPAYTVYAKIGDDFKHIGYLDPVNCVIDPNDDYNVVDLKDSQYGLETPLAEAKEFVLEDDTFIKDSLTQNEKKEAKNKPCCIYHKEYGLPSFRL